MVRCLLWKITCLYQIIKDYYRGSGNQQLRQVFKEIWEGKLTSNGVIWGRIILGFSSPTETKLWVRSCSICANMLEKINLWHLTFISQYLLQRKQLVLLSGQKPEEKCYSLQRSNSTLKKKIKWSSPKEICTL